MRVEIGCAGHFIGGHECYFRRHTQVGNFRISTVGEYHPNGPSKKQSDVRPGYAYETMVFPTGKQLEKCGCCQVLDWSGIESQCYKTIGEAQVGHEEIVARYEAQLCGNADC